jgi:hypothetical protein
MEQRYGPQAGTFCPKRLYNMNQMTEELQNLALGLIPDSNDAEKTIAKNWNCKFVFSQLPINSYNV